VDGNEKVDHGVRCDLGSKCLDGRGWMRQ
jgi:hypothetical protein